jgi:hypothetical protein
MASISNARFKAATCSSGVAGQPIRPRPAESGHFAGIYGFGPSRVGYDLRSHGSRGFVHGYGYTHGYAHDGGYDFDEGAVGASTIGGIAAGILAGSMQGY